MSGTTNTGSVDLESVLNVRRRNLASIGERSLTRFPHFNNNTIYLKREDHSNSVLSIDSKILIFGELQLLYSIFERYTSSITIYEHSNQDDSNSFSPSSSKTASFSATAEENENDEEGPPIVSTLRQASISSSKGSTSPPQAPSSPTGQSVNPFRRKTISSIGRANTIGATASDYSSTSLEGKRYGCVEVGTMTIIEILEILLRTGLELVDVLSDYDKEHVLHQEFIFSKMRQPTTKPGGGAYSRTSSFAGT